MLTDRRPETATELARRARETARRQFGAAIYTRGLIEIGNVCRNDCYYCGIRKSNRNAIRYRLTTAEILACCAQGYASGFRTFVLQSGEETNRTDDFLERTVGEIRNRYPDCAITLSVGEKRKEVYERFFRAGANRYLLRHETYDPIHYAALHPAALSPSNRIRCLWDLKEIGFQVGTGFMVGSPGQQPEHLAADIAFIERLKPEMIGIGPFLPHRDTPFAAAEKGSLSLTLRLISLFRLMFPKALIPATTALGTIDPTGREQGILAGANVVMPNLSPIGQRQNYMLYDHKICTGEEGVEGRQLLQKRMEAIGYVLSDERGDYDPKEKK